LCPVAPNLSYRRNSDVAAITEFVVVVVVVLSSNTTKIICCITTSNRATFIIKLLMA
jgi:hypothetical protein